MNKIKDFITNLQNLPEDKKGIIFFVTIAIVALVAAFFGILLTKNNITLIGESLTRINMPSIEIPTRDVAVDIGVSDLDLQDLATSLENLSTEDWETYSNSTYAYSIKYPNDWRLDKDHASDLEFHLLKKEGDEQFLIDMEFVSQTRNIADPEGAIDTIVKRMEYVVKPKEKITIGNNTGYEAIGKLCTALCDDLPNRTYSLFSIVYFSHGSQVFYLNYVEGITDLGFKDDIKNWKNYEEFKNIISTFKFTN